MDRERSDELRWQRQIGRDAKQRIRRAHLQNGVEQLFVAVRRFDGDLRLLKRGGSPFGFSQHTCAFIPVRG